MPTTSWHVRGAVPKLDNTPHCLKFVGITSRPLPLPLSVTPAHQPLLFNTAPTTSIVAFPSPFSIGLPHLFGKSPSAHTGWYHSSVLHWPVCLHLGAASSSSANLQHARRNQLSVPMLFVLLTPPFPTSGMIQQQYQSPTPQSRQNGLGPCGRAEQTLYLGDPMAPPPQTWSNPPVSTTKFYSTIVASGLATPSNAPFGAPISPTRPTTKRPKYGIGLLYRLESRAVETAGCPRL